MRRKANFSDILYLFLTFLKVGALTFGGGYAMIPIINREVVEKRKWLQQSEIIDILAISEATPGPVAVNTATYVGYKVAGFWGSFFATLGLVTPSFLIILLISFFYKQFMEISIINAAFKGIRAGVIILLLNAVNKLRKSIKLDILSIVLFCIAFAAMVVSLFVDFNLSIGSFNISLSIILILFGLLVGIISVPLSRGGKKE